jgi:putative Holliday junction resolvase
MMQNHNGRIVALDVGAKRIGVASANVIARLASPLTTLTVGPDILEDIKQLLAKETAVAMVLGLPRGLDGQVTEQTRRVQAFGDELEAHLSVPVYWQDEALTSVKSEEELRAKGGNYTKGAVDALAATYILEDFLASGQEVPNGS